MSLHQIRHFLAQASGASFPWWQIMTGILAIPISILGLVYAYLLYQKTRLEARCLELEIEKERQPGLPGISESKTERTRCENDRARSRSNRSRRWATLIAVLIAAAIIWILPRPFPISTFAWSALLRLSMIQLGVLTILAFNSALRGRSPWVFGTTTTVTSILAVLVFFSFLYFRSQYVVQVEVPDETWEFTTGTTLTESAKQYLRTNAGLTKQDLLMDFSPGNEDKIWTAESIAFVKRGLFILYAISILLVSTFVASAVRLLGFVWLEKTSKIGLARGTPD